MLNVLSFPPIHAVMSIYAETSGPTTTTRTTTAPRPRASTYCNRPLPPLPNATKQKRRCVRRPTKTRLSHFPTPPPILLAREQADALSLQDHTFLYIISNVDQYPTELLSLLPLHIRRKLLSALPPFRLYQLERTAIARDIDTNKMWEELSQQQDCVWGGYLRDEACIHLGPITDLQGKEQSSEDSPRACFVNYLSHLIFNEMNRDYACKRITELLHAIHVDMLEPSVANGLICGHVSSLFMFQPPYHLIPFRCRNLTERELYWLLHSNRMLPTSLELYTYNIEFSPLWNQDVISQGMMRRLLSKLSFLRIYSHAYRTIQLEDITDAVTHSSCYKDPPSNLGCLKHLEVLRADYRDLTTIVPYFSAPHGYSNLTSLTISMRPVSYLQATRHLGVVIRHQLNTLQHLELRGFSCSIYHNKIHTSDYMFFSSLISFILKPRFRTLTLHGFKDLPWAMLKMLLQANLRTVPSHKQTITLRDVNITTSGVFPTWIEEDDSDSDSDSGSGKDGENQFCPASESKCLEYKRIHFLNAKVPLRVLNWFQSIDGLYLNTLEFNRVQIEMGLTDAFIVETSPDGVDWGCFRHYTTAEKKNHGLNQKQLKARLMQHQQLECRVFVWEAVTTVASSFLCV